MNPISTMRSLLLAKAGITALVGARVYGVDFEAAETATWVTPSDVQKSIVVRVAPGGTIDSAAPVMNVEYELYAYGPSDVDIAAIAQAVQDNIHGVRKVEVGTIAVCTATQQGMPEYGEEQDTGWKYAVINYRALLIE